jgi:AraC family ethanolamine operon transcriptional activator
MFSEPSNMHPSSAPTELPRKSCTEVRATARDVFEQAANLPEWTQDYWQLDFGCFHGETQAVSLQHAQLFRETMNRSVDQLGQAPSGRLVLGIPLHIQGDGFWAGHAIPHDSLLTLRGGDELNFRTPQVSDMGFITVEIDSLCRHALRLYGLDITGQLQKQRYVSFVATDTAQRFRQFLQMALHHALSDTDHQGHSHLMEDLCEACLSLLDLGECRSEPREGQRVHRYLVNAVRERVLDNRGDVPTIGELAQELRVSGRTLHHAFNKVLGVNVITYVRSVRLHEARRALRNSPASAGRVRSAATDNGFWHLGLFSRHYFELFGELPSQTRATMVQ